MNGSGVRKRSSEEENKNKNDKMSTAVSSDVVITSFKKLVIEYKPTGKTQGRKGVGGWSKVQEELYKGRVHLNYTRNFLTI